MGDACPRPLLRIALPELVAEVKAAVPKNLFAPEIDPSFFHGDATSSFKETGMTTYN
jgi:hypothetical protein